MEYPDTQEGLRIFIAECKKEISKFIRWEKEASYKLERMEQHETKKRT